MKTQIIQPTSLQAALDALAQYGDQAKVLGGGTALALMLQNKLIAPRVLVSLEHLPDLDYIRFEAEGLHLGPMATLRDIERSAMVCQSFPAFAKACSLVGNVRIRNQATLGGNLAEADYASDPPATLLALDSLITATSASGSRLIPVSDFFVGFFATILQPDEIITDILLPETSAGSGTAYLKYKSRSSEDRPCVVVAVKSTIEDQVCSELRIAVGAACEIPQRIPEIESWAKGRILSDELICEIAEGYASKIETLDDLRGSAWYRSRMIGVQVRRALLEVRDGHR